MPDGERPQLRPSAAPEALLVCPICMAGLGGSDYETHLRQVHRLFGYRGVRRSLDDTIEAMLDDLLHLPPFAIAWPAMLRLCREEYGGRIETFLASRLGTALGKLPRPTLGKVLPDLVALIAPGNSLLIAALAGEHETACRLFALAALAVLPPPLDPVLMRPLRRLLLDRELPEEMQVQALAAILPSISDEQQFQNLLEKAVGGLSKPKAVHRLGMLEKRIGVNPIITAMVERFQEQARMSCPHCGIQMRRPAMTQHLWEEHRLVLDGLRVRDPWNIIEEWLESYKAHRDLDELLDRCRIAAAKIDPDEGPSRLQRLMLAHGVADAEVRRELLGEAREHHAARCPWCCELVPVPAEGSPPPVSFRPGRLSACGYSVEIDERGLWTSLDVRTPIKIIQHGREPNRQYTPKGMALLASGPVVLLAFLFALLWPRSLGLPIIVPVVVTLTLAAVVHWVVRLLARAQQPISDRVLDYTWRLLVPRLHKEGFVAEDSAFLAGLALLHNRVGKTAVQPEELARVIRLTEPAVKKGEVPSSHLAALCRLDIECAADAGEDPVPRVAGWLAKCFDGRLPLVFAQRMLEEWVTDWWTRGNLARLRIHLCDQAFEASFEVHTLIEAGQNAPALGTVLRIDAPVPLAALRLLWSLRPSRPWDRLGDAKTAFELAADFDHLPDLAEQPDVLLWMEDPRIELVTEDGRDPMGPARVQLTPVGVSVQDVMFRDPPRVFELRLRSWGSELHLGFHTFRSTVDLESLSRQLERWFRFGFHEFLPQVERVLSWQPPDRSAILRAWGAVPCPACSRHLLPRVGEVGIAVHEAM